MSTSALMKAVRRRDTDPEIALRLALWRRGLRYRLHVRSLPGTPDIVLRRYRTVVFVDGDYWHGRILLERGRAALMKSFRPQHRAFWVAKIERNVERDAFQTNQLAAMGWTVVRVWERDVMRDPEGVAHLIACAIDSAPGRNRRVSTQPRGLRIFSA